MKGILYPTLCALAALSRLPFGEGKELFFAHLRGAIRLLPF